MDNLKISDLLVQDKLTIIPNFVREAMHDRVVGSLVGSALGDAIGLYTEFLSGNLSRATYPSARFTLSSSGDGPTKFCDDMHRGPHREGEWTDDTDQALLILLGFLHCSRAANEVKLDPRDFGRRLKIWVDCGLRALDTMPLGLGNLVGTVVRSKEYAKEMEEDGGENREQPGQMARAVWERTKRRNAPNGSLMRTHPLGAICLRRSEEETFDAAAAFSRVTHTDPRCVYACAAGTALIRGLLRGEVNREDDIDAVFERARTWFTKDVEKNGTPEDPPLEAAELERHIGRAVTFADLELDDRGTIGYVYKTLGSGVVSLRLAMRRDAESKGALLSKSAMFEDLITDITMAGGDADTNACFAGALLGAYLGYGLLPGHWKHGLIHEAWLMGKCEALCQVLGVVGGEYDGATDADTRPDGGRGLLDQKDMEKRWDGVMRRMLEKKEAALKVKKAKEEREKAGKSGFKFW